jgi:peroxiredoxin
MEILQANMRLKPKFGLFTCLLLIAGALYYLLFPNLTTLPNVVFKTIKGETISQAALLGKPALITFWATDCPSCIKEIPDLIKLHQQYTAQGLTIIAVAMYYDPPNQVVTMATEKQLPYAVALDPNAELAHAFGNVQFTPTTFLIDKTGAIVMKKSGLFSLPTLQEWLNTQVLTIH